MNNTYLYNPYKWLPSLQRSLQEYVMTGAKNSIVNGDDEPVGDQVYQVEFDFPSPDHLARLMPLPKTLIHFVIDDIENPTLGFGDGVVNSILDAEGQTVIEEQTAAHVVNFDVGVWASDNSGGSTARLEAYQLLTDLFAGPRALGACREQTGGVEIRSFDGGRFVLDSINDVGVFRIVDTTLVVRVYSLNAPDPAVVVGEIVQDPELTVGDEILIDVPTP
jgi:hypothetical protein